MSAPQAAIDTSTIIRENKIGAVDDVGNQSPTSESETSCVAEVGAESKGSLVVSGAVISLTSAKGQFGSRRVAVVEKPVAR